ncbi:MAG: phage holin family protein [Chitinivibrionales bacterium]
MGFLPRLVTSALSLGVAAYILPGIYIDGMLTLVVAAFLLGIVNAVVRPVLVVLTLPVTLITLGLFLLVINAAMLGLVAWMLPGFEISGLGTAIIGWLIIFLISWIASQVFGD